jgi:predicted component of type VI protein secretion system
MGSAAFLQLLASDANTLLPSEFLQLLASDANTLLPSETKTVARYLEQSEETSYVGT